MTSTYNKEALTSILSEQKVDIVITHTSPSFCELLSKEGIAKWTGNDKTLISDILQEREVMNSLYETLKEHQQHGCQSWRRNASFRDKCQRRI